MDCDCCFDSEDQSISVVRSLLGVGPLQVRPFPHLWSASCLMPSHHERLAAKFPPWRSLATGTHHSSNAGIRFPSSRVLETEAFPGEWRRFVEHHTSQAFWKEIAQVFGDEIRFHYPELERELDRPLGDWRVVRRSDGIGAEITLECEIVVTPAEIKRPPPPEVPRTANAIRLWTGLLNLSVDCDESQVNSSGGLDASRGDGLCQVPFPQSANTFVGFVESPGSVRCVGEPPRHLRSLRFVEFSVHVNRPAYGLLSRGAAHQEWFRFFQRQGYR